MYIFHMVRIALVNAINDLDSKRPNVIITPIKMQISHIINKENYHIFGPMALKH